MPPWLTETADGILLALKVQPRASRNCVVGPLGDELKVSLTAPPVDSAANIAAIEFLAKQLNVAKNSVQLVRGLTSRHKVFSVRGVSAAEAAKRLGPG